VDDLGQGHHPPGAEGHQRAGQVLPHRLQGLKQKVRGGTLKKEKLTLGIMLLLGRVCPGVPRFPWGGLWGYGVYARWGRGAESVTLSCLASMVPRVSILYTAPSH
jgi:hypothetical protein